MVAKNFNYDIDLLGNEVQNAVLQNLATTPSTNAKAGRFWYDTANNKPMYHNGTTAKEFGKEYTFNSDSFSNSNDAISLKIATASTLGGVKISGNHLTINSSTGVVSVDEASTSQKGVIEIATDSECTTGTSEVLAVNPKQLATKVSKLTTKPTAGTYTKLTINAEGQVTAGSSLAASDIPDISSLYLAATLKGAASGVAELDSSGKVPSSQLPSFVDDVVDAYIVSGATALSSGWLSATDGGSALTPETGKIYVVLTSGSYQNKTYRYSGSTYVEISASPGAASESAAGIIEIATTAEVQAGTDDTRAITPSKLAAAIANFITGISSSDVTTALGYTPCKKITANNTALTASSGVCTWEITNSIGSADVLVQVRNKSTGEIVEVAETVTSSKVTIKLNSSSNIAANTYTAVIIG